jgi:hypothetical protein
LKQKITREGWSMETAPQEAQIEDYKQRVDALRRYLWLWR